jgi:hypothetical protein
VSGLELEATSFDRELIEAIAARLDLRQPNRGALESIVYAVNQHYDVDQSPGTVVLRGYQPIPARPSR